MNGSEVTQKDIFRLSAVLYAETHETFSATDIQSDIIRCIIANGDNAPLSYEEIAAGVASSYHCHLAEDEIIRAIARSKSKVYEIKKSNGQETVKLTSLAYKKTKESIQKNIDYYIGLFLSEYPEYDNEQCKYAIQKYLYELTTSNINSYKVLLGGVDGSKLTGSDLSVDVKDLNDAQRDMVHRFIEWDNVEKNEALSNIVLCCLEYCLLVNGDHVNPLVAKTIRNRKIYLDTNIIFRALGINGSSRAKVIIAFLKKCQQAGLKLFISEATEKEFFNAVSYYIEEIRKYPRGHVFIGAYEMLCDYNMFSFFESWGKTHPDASLNYFLVYIKSLYIKFCSEYGIQSNEKIPPEIYNSEEYKNKRTKYITSIQAKKAQINDYYISEDTYYSPRNSHDATIVAYVEMLRASKNEEDDIFIVSSDKALRLWDMTRASHSYPVVVYPSQLFLILIKMVGRSEDDFKSFVSFINIRPRSNQLTAEKANIIISGISSVTEDINAQTEIVSAVYDEEFQNIIRHSNSDLELYQKVQQYSQRYLDYELEEKDRSIETMTQKIQAQGETITSVSNERDKERKRAEEAENLTEEQKQLIAQRELELKNKENTIQAFAARKTRTVYLVKNWIIPLIVVIMIIAVAAFIALQFFFCDKEWNFAVRFFNWASKTTFGQMVGDFLYAIDLAILAALGFCIKKGLRNPFNKQKSKKLKEELIQHYLSQNQLDN